MRKKFWIINFIVFGFLFWHFAKEMLQVKPQGWFVGQVNLYGDLVFHLGLINKFLVNLNPLPQSPIYSGGKPNYPIFADYLTALIARFSSIDFALFITTFITGLLVIYIARHFIKNYIKNEKVVFLSLLLFFINGGFGFYYFFQDLFTSNKSLLSFMLAMPHEYTDLKTNGYWWINNYLAYFLPQRAFLFAFPITLTVLSLLYFGFQKNKRRFFFLAGLLTGALPLVQSHSLFFLFIVSSLFATATIIYSKFKKDIILNWLIFGVTTAVLAIPLFKLLSSQSDILTYIRFAPGWTSKENIIVFWIKNLGLFAPLLVVSIIWIYTKSHQLFFLYLPFLFVFIISNIFIFQPWEFDNSKLLIYWYFVSCILVSYFLYEWFFTENLSRKILGILLVFLMTFAGSLDIFRTFTPVTSYQIFSNEDLIVAKTVKEATPQNSIFTTAPIHNHPISALSGRSTVIGFYGWIWSHGLPHQQRAYDIQKIYAGAPDFDTLIKKYKVSYVTVGPYERQNFDINETFMSQFPKITIDQNWSLYDVSHLWPDDNRQN